MRKEAKKLCLQNIKTKTKKWVEGMAQGGTELTYKPEALNSIPSTREREMFEMDV
jgi:hypothetical protein